MSIQTQCILKNTSGSVTVKFTEAYATPPLVILTPFNQGTPGPVSNVLTLTEVTTTSCTFTSIDAASNYYVNVLSIGSTASSEIKSTKAEWGTKAKTGITLSINYHPNLSSPVPVVLLTSFWKDSQQSAFHPETLKTSQANGCTIESENGLPSNYYVNFLAMDLGMTSIDSNRPIQNGIQNKTGQGTQRVYFSKQFNGVPTVFLSSWWDDSSKGGVGSIETLVNVTEEYFEFNSINWGANYFVNWLAVGN